MAGSPPLQLQPGLWSGPSETIPPNGARPTAFESEEPLGNYEPMGLQGIATTSETGIRLGYFDWADWEIQRRLIAHLSYLPIEEIESFNIDALSPTGYSRLTETLETAAQDYLYLGARRLGIPLGDIEFGYTGSPTSARVVMAESGLDGTVTVMIDNIVVQSLMGGRDVDGARLSATLKGHLAHELVHLYHIKDLTRVSIHEAEFITGFIFEELGDLSSTQREAFYGSGGK